MTESVGGGSLKRSGPELVVIAGPTGSGKSAVASPLAQQIGGEVVNFDSVQIYCGFDIGSAKPTLAERQHVPHHLYDIAEATDEFNAADFAEAAERVCAEIESRGGTPVLVGGTGFYLRAFLSGLPDMPGAEPQLRARIRAISERPRGPERLHAWLKRVDPSAAARISPADRHRVERALEVWSLTGRPITDWRAPSAEGPPRRAAKKFALQMPRTQLLAMLEDRVERMYADGLIRETQLLLEKYPVEARPFGSIGYREAVRFLSGEISRAEAIAETKRRTRAYSKRQMTWLRGERDLCWINASEGSEAALAEITEKLFRG